jgi:hypothetical protein
VLQLRRDGGLLEFGRRASQRTARFPISVRRRRSVVGARARIVPLTIHLHRRLVAMRLLLGTARNAFVIAVSYPAIAPSLPDPPRARAN